MIVTIDGPAGTGKSSAARNLAARLEYDFLDTGSMYRSVAWQSLRDGIETADADALAELSNNIQIEFDGFHVIVNGQDVSREIRTPEVTQLASSVATVPAVREHLVEKQRAFAVGRSIVTEGRDQGTIVFPFAQCKFFLTADPGIRVQRRYRELQSQGKTVPLAELENQQTERDRRDQKREIAPLKPADDAVVIDTSDMELEAVVDLLEDHVRQRHQKS